MEEVYEEKVYEEVIEVEKEYTEIDLIDTYHKLNVIRKNIKDKSEEFNIFFNKIKELLNNDYNIDYK